MGGWWEAFTLVLYLTGRERNSASLLCCPRPRTHNSLNHQTESHQRVASFHQKRPLRPWWFDPTQRQCPVLCQVEKQSKELIIKSFSLSTATFITWCFMLNEFGKLWAYRNFQCLHVKCHYIVLPTTLITIINDILPNVVFGDRLFDIRRWSLTIEGEIQK